MGKGDVAGDTFRLMMTKDMLLLTPGFLYTGLETAFWTGVYATALINTSAFALHHNTTYALNAIAIGLGEVLGKSPLQQSSQGHMLGSGGGTFGILGAKTLVWGRNPIIILGVVAHGAAFYVAYLVLPDCSPIDCSHCAPGDPGCTGFWAPS